MKKTEYFNLVAVIILVTAMTIFFGTRKADYHLDEVWNYGLANHIGSTQPDIEMGVPYEGMGPYENFVQVNSGERFNYINVWQNQGRDVHPPLYYIFFHTVCSLFPDTFSKWYGIAVNIMWMIFSTFALYILVKDITKSATTAIGVVLAFETTTQFFDIMMFIRMYAQLMFATIIFALLIKKYWQKELDKRFYALYTLAVLFGMLTHYYFLIYAFFISAGFAVRLILDKRFVELKRCVITALCDGVAFMLIWYHFGGHLLRGYRGKQAIKEAFTFGDFLDKFTLTMSSVNKTTFAGLMILFVIIVLVMIAVRTLKKEMKYSYDIMLICCAALYTIVICKIAPFTHFRYLVPVLFIYVMSAYLALKELVLRLFSKKSVEYGVIALFLAMNLWTMHSNAYYVPMDYHSEEKSEFCESLKDKDCLVMITVPWESLNFFVALPNAKSYTFITPDMLADALKQKENGCVIATTSEYSKQLDEGIRENKLFQRGGELYYYYDPAG